MLNYILFYIYCLTDAHNIDYKQ